MRGEKRNACVPEYNISEGVANAPGLYIHTNTHTHVFRLTYFFFFFVRASEELESFYRPVITRALKVATPTHEGHG
jgi:hypothetical protein